MRDAPKSFYAKSVIISDKIDQPRDCLTNRFGPAKGELAKSWLGAGRDRYKS